MIDLAKFLLADERVLTELQDLGPIEEATAAPMMASYAPLREDGNGAEAGARRNDLKPNNSVEVVR